MDSEYFVVAIINLTFFAQWVFPFHADFLLHHFSVADIVFFYWSNHHWKWFGMEIKQMNHYVSGLEVEKVYGFEL